MGNRTKKSVNLLRVIGMVIVSVGANMGHAFMEDLLHYKDGGGSCPCVTYPNSWQWPGSQSPGRPSIRMIDQRVLLRLRLHVVAA